MQLCAIGTQGLQRSVGQVEGRSSGFYTEQGCITLSGSLYDFVFDREQVSRVLTGLAVRTDNDTLEFEDSLRTIY